MSDFMSTTPRPAEVDASLLERRAQRIAGPNHRPNHRHSNHPGYLRGERSGDSTEDPTTGVNSESEATPPLIRIDVIGFSPLRLVMADQRDPGGVQGVRDE